MDVYGVLGRPVEHSLSPAMQEAGFEALGIDARYVALEPREGALEAAVSGAGALGFAGLNVTVPFKEAVLDLVDPDDVARRIGAVNTVDVRQDPPRGRNTDAEGVTRAFEHHGVDLEDADAVVVGAGGAGRAATIGLLDAGARVSVANRTRERAAALAADAGEDATGHGLDALPDLLVDADVLVNATTVGMDEDASPVPADALHADLAVLDAVYSPLETRLLRDAASVGATTVDGAWMLLFQGVGAFEWWTGEVAPVDVMNAALRDGV